MKQKAEHADKIFIRNFLADYDNPIHKFGLFRKYEVSDTSFVENIRCNSEDVVVVKNLIHAFFYEKLDSDHYQETAIIQLMKKHNLADDHLINACRAKLK